MDLLMRTSPAIGLSLLVLFSGSSGVLGSDFKRQTNSPQAQSQSSILSEFRFGFSAQDPWGPEGREGSANLTGEILFSKPFTASDLFTSYFIPRPHLGGSLNFNDKTSFAYAGLSWTFDVTPELFVEGSLGGAIHNGKDVAPAFSDRQSLGCSPLFRESGSVGVRLSANWSVMATVEHLSNGGLCSDENRGLTNVGARVGYSF
jgi:lipid A 3-O-deacylase